MAENINPTQPVTAPLPVNPSVNEQQEKDRKEKPKQDKHNDDDQKQNERTHHGLFDEYV